MDASRTVFVEDNRSVNARSSNSVLIRWEMLVFKFCLLPLVSSCGLYLGCLTFDCCSAVSVCSISIGFSGCVVTWLLYWAVLEMYF